MHRNIKAGRKAIGNTNQRSKGTTNNLMEFTNAGMITRSGSSVPVESLIAQRRLRANEIVSNEIKMSKVAKKMEQSGGIKRRIFGIGKQQGGLTGSQLIHPYSPFSQLMTFTSGILLLYSALVSSTMIGFMWNADPCEKMETLEFDMFVDVFFLVEIITNFFTGVIVKGEYKDQISFVAEEYIKGMFFFDVGTSIPVSFIEYSALLQCEDGDGMSNQGLRVVRALKPLKVFRMLRSLKFLKVVEMFAHVGDYLRIPPFIGRIVKMLVIVMLLCHACACMYWLVKELSNSSDELDNWLISQNIPLGQQASLYEKYVIAFYFINTVFCTVGFGDIAAENSEERLFNVVMFYCGALVFGTLLAEVQDALNKTRHKYRERQNTIQLMIDFLRSQEVPLHLEQRIIRWVDFSMSCLQNHEAQQEVLDVIPPNLHRELLGHLHGGASGYLNFIGMFADIHHEQKEQLVLDLWAQMEPVVCSAFVPLASSQKPADRMYVIMAGTVILQDDGVLHTTLHPGDAFGEYSLLGDIDWGACRTLGPATYTAITNVMCLCLRKESFEEVLASFEPELGDEIYGSYTIKREKHINARRESMESDPESKALNPRVVLRWGEICKQLVKNRRIRNAKKGLNSADTYSASTSLMIGRAALKIARKADENIFRKNQKSTTRGQGSNPRTPDHRGSLAFEMTSPRSTSPKHTSPKSSSKPQAPQIPPKFSKTLSNKSMDDSQRKPSDGGIIEPGVRGAVTNRGGSFVDRSGSGEPPRKASNDGIIERAPSSSQEDQQVRRRRVSYSGPPLEGNGHREHGVVASPEVLQEIKSLSSKVDDIKQSSEKINQLSASVDVLRGKLDDVSQVSAKVDALSWKMDALTRLVEVLARDESVIAEDQVHISQAVA